jgi:hypothetical protein
MAGTKPIQMPVIGPERHRSVDLAMLAIAWLPGICLAVLAVTTAGSNHMRPESKVQLLSGPPRHCCRNYVTYRTSST